MHCTIIFDTCHVIRETFIVWQELKEELISHAKKVVVVKKRQLQLFAGQPLADVEKALRSLITQDQDVP